MTFDNQYLTYSEYQELGGTLEELPFNLLEYECRKIIDRKTLNRLSEQEIPQEVKLCDFKMINCVDNYSKTLSSGISSESTDGYSVSYGDNKTLIEAKQDELEDIVTTALFGVVVNNEHLIYIGVK